MQDLGSQESTAGPGLRGVEWDEGHGTGLGGTWAELSYVPAEPFPLACPAPGGPGHLGAWPGAGSGAMGPCWLVVAGCKRGLC